MKTNIMLNIHRQNYQLHPYHLVDNSPWPIFTSFTLFGLAMNTALTMHGYIGTSLWVVLSVVCVFYVSFLWFRDIVSEGTYLGNHTIAVRNGINLGFLLFIASETLFFIGIFWAFGHSAIAPTVEIGAMWPPMGIQAIGPTELPLLNTILLLSSGVCLKCNKLTLNIYFKIINKLNYYFNNILFIKKKELLLNNININIKETLSILPFNKPKIRSLDRIGPHNINILSILIGSLLGDGTMERDGNGSRFGFYQEKKNGEYLLTLHKYISDLGYTKFDIPKLQTRKGLNDNLRYIYRFRTYTYSSFNWIHESFYPNNRKIIPKNINLERYITPLTIAMWIMDDGCLHKNRGISFSTNSFTLDDIKYLGNILKYKYNINYSIVKTGAINQYNIYIPKESSIKLGKIVKNYMVPCMYYKLPTECFI